MKIDRDTLLEILASVKPALAQKNVVEQQFSHFVFTGRDVVAYNDMIWISRSLETDFVGSVNAVDFHSAVTSMDGGDIEVKLTDQLYITSPTAEAGLAYQVEGHVFDVLETVDLDKCMWRPLSEDFIEAIVLCLFSTSRDMTQGVYTCVYVAKDAVYSTDDYRVSMYTMDSEVVDSFLLPFSSAIELVRFPVKEYCLGPSWVYFRTDNDVVFSSRIMKGEFPDCSNVFTIEEGVRVRLPRDTLTDAVGSAASFAEGKIDLDRKIKIEVRKDELVCYGKKEAGWIKKVLPIRYGRSPVEFYINPIFLLQVLDKTSVMVFGKGVAMFYSKKFRHIMSLPIGK